MKFIYVMDVGAKDKLLSLGYTLLKASQESNVWIFDACKANQSFSNEDELESVGVPYVLSNVLTF